MPTSLPISDPVLIFALAMGIFLLAPLIFERMKIPGLMGLIFFGAVVGPNVLNLLARDFTFELLGQVGLLYLVFLAGLELDLNRFNEYRSRSIVFGILSFGIPMGLAGRGHAPPGVLDYQAVASDRGHHRVAHPARLPGGEPPGDREEPGGDHGHRGHPRHRHAGPHRAGRGGGLHDGGPRRRSSGCASSGCWASTPWSSSGGGAAGGEVVLPERAEPGPGGVHLPHGGPLHGGVVRASSPGPSPSSGRSWRASP
jgi:hypothetical protein